MLLCQNAQTFNLEGSLVSGPGPQLPSPRELTGSEKSSLHLGAHRSLQRPMCSLLKTWQKIKMSKIEEVDPVPSVHGALGTLCEHPGICYEVSQGRF